MHTNFHVVWGYELLILLELLVSMVVVAYENCSHWISFKLLPSLRWAVAVRITVSVHLMHLLYLTIYLSSHTSKIMLFSSWLCMLAFSFDFINVYSLVKSAAHWVSKLVTSAHLQLIYWVYLACKNALWHDRIVSHWYYLFLGLNLWLPGKNPPLYDEPPAMYKQTGNWMRRLSWRHEHIEMLHPFLKVHQ